MTRLRPLLNLRIADMQKKIEAGAKTVLSINSQNPQMRLIKKASDVLRDGGIIIYPTDTVYGLGCDLSNKRGIERIYEIKRRNKKRPLSFVCSDLKHISQYALVTDYAYKTMKRFLPGPYTFILEASRLVPKIILPKRPTTGIPCSGQSDLFGPNTRTRTADHQYQRSDGGRGGSWQSGAD
jgi:hypothetical protein